ncbi:MAG: glycosyltransferase family 4 protein [Proteobacteria bacterium]|nr:glycosyltransferase family 4 protein [Pseudomonadota bacterium]
MPLSKLRDVAHRHLWQKLPLESRRAIFLGLTGYFAPRPSVNATPSFPIVVAGAFSTSSGLGQSARLCHAALSKAGLPVHALDITEQLLQPSDFGAPQSAPLLDLEGRGTLILHVNAPVLPFAMSRVGRRIVRNKFIVGYWHWELPEAPPAWQPGARLVHQIWTPSHFTAGACAKLSGAIPIHILPHPIAERLPDQASVRARDVARPFQVLTIFNAASSIARKNPVAAIAAFRRAFGADASSRLIIKSSNLDTAARDELASAIAGQPNITLLEGIFSDSEMDRLYAEADAVLSLHRSEGFGLLVAEAMLRGIPAIATDWSATSEFLDAATGFPVPFALVPAIDPQGIYAHPDLSWADADIEAAAAALMRLKADPALAQRIGEAARSHALSLWSADRYAAAALDALRLPPPPRGPSLG